MRDKKRQNIPEGVGWAHMIDQKPEMNDGPVVKKESMGCGKEIVLKDENNGVEQSPWRMTEEDANTVESIKEQRRISMS
jgi:hypothetical protein